MRRYLVGTHSFLVSLHVDEAWRVQEHHVLNEGHHYGIAFSEKEKRTVMAKRPNSGGNELIIFGAKMPNERLGTHHLERISKSHQMAIANGGIYVANTGFNSVVYQHLEEEIRHEYHFFGVRHDQNHVNSVFPCGEQVYVLLHNRLRRLSQVAVLEHDLDQGFRLQALLDLWNAGCHNLYVDGKNQLLYYNASQVGEFVAVELLRERVKTRLRFPDDALSLFPHAGAKRLHTKGLSVTENNIVVGLSEHASRKDRLRTRGYLAALDRATLSLIAIIDLNFSGLPHGVGNINEVRCLSEPEHAQAMPHALDIDWSSMRLARSNGWRYTLANVMIYSRNVGKVGKQMVERLWPRLFYKLKE